jgi:phosphoribosyl 1,2-cyclic phosphodiesterase
VFARVVPLGSGSSGNATLVEMGGVRILVDAGLSARATASRLLAVGVEPESIRAVLLSHEHHDHARGAPRFSLRHRVPVACAAETLRALNVPPSEFFRWVPFESGRAFDVAGVRVDAFSVPHDAADPVGFVLESGGVRIGVATDLGHATTLVVERLRRCHVLMVEANHDDRLLRDGPYPWQLKQRIGGRMGHLSNDEAASLLAEAASDDCRAIVLAHLSEKNNDASLARRTVADRLARSGRKRFEMRVAERSRPTSAVVL